MPTITLNLPETLWNQLQSYRQGRGAALGIPVIDERLAIQQLLLFGLAGLPGQAGQAGQADSMDQPGLAGVEYRPGQAVPAGLSNPARHVVEELERAVRGVGQKFPVSDGFMAARKAANGPQTEASEQRVGLRRPHFSAAHSLPESGSNASARHGSCFAELS